MANNYNQLRAMLAIARGSFKGMLRNPSAVAFGFGFPLVIILVFGSIGGGGPKVSVALSRQADTANPIVKGLVKTTLVTLSDDTDTASIRKDLERGRIAALISVDTATTAAGIPQYIVHTQTSSASGDKYPILQLALARVFQIGVERNMPLQYKPIVIDELPKLPGRQYSMIDFIIPGMLGFSLLGSAVFGVAFLFFGLRQQLVLKRYYATPIGKPYIILGEALARVVFQMITAVVIIVIGKFVYHFTLVHGWVTFWEIMFLSLVGLIVFMGLGFIISSVARSESTIPPVANLFTLPQMLLGGTFFSTDVFPKWLQNICEILPLKQLNDAMRNVSFEGAHLTDCGKQLGILAIWGIVTYAVAVKVFKWE
ncbi:ABC transporter permease [Puia sp.]|jgi:ABC-2 type transport system permease protein|uniref:ABC transporter permease n=1 Tax=Puia sp. TaxID=2045100 RepID=UPI002F3F7456